MKHTMRWMIGASMIISGLAAQPAQSKPMMDCSNLSSDLQQFAALLNPANKMMFCGKFNDAMRIQSIQAAAQADSDGKAVMSPDQAVESVARMNNMMPAGTTPRGCPVK